MKTKAQIDAEINNCLTRTHLPRRNKKYAPYPLTADAWYLTGITTFDDRSKQDCFDRLLKNTKTGLKGKVLELAAELGEWWLAQTENAKHLCREDVQASIVELRRRAAAY